LLPFVCDGGAGGLLAANRLCENSACIFFVIRSDTPQRTN